ncbi:MAG: potassium-transporting ATPase subunit KdpC [Acidobacteria bacterium]|nr:MAG: potassium-transporting ATPase subunit KdpC [Acidobacteriota bacterium]
MWRQIAIAFRVLLFMTVLTGLIYPGVVTALCQVLFPQKANGSLVRVNDTVVGSSLIGQNFTKPQYFQPRPSAAGNGYDASNSSGSNYGPTNQKLIDRIKASIVKFREENPDYNGPIPADLVTASASGLDPDISLGSAEAQAARVAQARGVPRDEIKQLIGEQTEGRALGFLGEPRVNVLELNLALDHRFPAAYRAVR